MQDAIVIAVAIAAAAWLARRTIRRLLAPGCGGPATRRPGASDPGAFVPLDRLVASAPGRTLHKPSRQNP